MLPLLNDAQLRFGLEWVAGVMMMRRPAVGRELGRLVVRMNRVSDPCPDFAERLFAAMGQVVRDDAPDGRRIYAKH